MVKNQKEWDILNFNISSKFTVYKAIYTLINVGETLVKRNFVGSSLLKRE